MIDLSSFLIIKHKNEEEEEEEAEEEEGKIKQSHKQD